MNDERSQILSLLASLPQSIRAEAENALESKNGVARMKVFFEAVAVLANSHNLIPGTSPTERRASFDALVRHAECLWDDAALLLTHGSYPTSLFLAIVALEELGKVSVGKIQAVTGVPSTAVIQGVGGARSKLRSHTKKQIFAAAAGAVINTRLDRLVGIERVIAFIERAESGALESARQDCLYYDVRDGSQVLPYETITRKEAEEAVVISGELLAEVGSIEPGEWERLLAKVEAFEGAHTWLGKIP